jgi:ferredoxin/uncharacterized protein YuzE
MLRLGPDKLLLRYDRQSDILRIVVSENTAKEEQIDEDIAVGYSSEGSITGFRIENARRRIIERLGLRLGPREPTAENLVEGSTRVRIDADACLGFGSCAIVAPSVFRLEETPGRDVFQSRAKLDVLDESGGEDFERLLLAAESCPTRAIILEDRKTGKQIYP